MFGIVEAFKNEMVRLRGSVLEGSIRKREEKNPQITVETDEKYKAFAGWQCF